MTFSRIPNIVLLRCLLVVAVCLSTLMVMVSFKTASSNVVNLGQFVITERFNVPPVGGRYSEVPMAARKLASAPWASTSSPPPPSSSKVDESTSRRAKTMNWTKSKPISAFDYPFVLEASDICERHRPDVFALIYVHTAPKHFKHRSVIRRTWGDSKLYDRLRTVTVFFVGRSAEAGVEDAIALESQRYGDIVQADFVDSYKNLSVKAVVALRWIAEHCGERPLYVVKTDDDIFVNVFNLVRHLHYLRKYDDETGDSDQRRCISCLLWTTMGVMRNPKSKWYVSKAEFAEDQYPAYCSGSAFFMYTSVALKLYNASTTAPFLWVDDVYATGILAHIAGIGHTGINSIFALSKAKYDSQLIQGEAVFGHMTGDAGVDLREQYWKKVVQKEESAVFF